MCRRKLFTLAAGVSAVLCAVVCVLWVRSYWSFDAVAWDGANDRVLLAGGVRGGIILVSVGREPDVPEGLRPSPAPSPAWRVERGPPEDAGAWPFGSPPEREWRFAGLWYRSVGVGAPGFLRFRSLFLPYWLLLLVTASVPAVHSAARRRRRRVAASRQRQGRCPACGYDLRATPGRCPECGSVPAEGAAA